MITGRIKPAEPVIQRKGEESQPTLDENSAQGARQIANQRVVDDIVGIVEVPGDIEGIEIGENCRYQQQQGHNGRAQLPAPLVRAGLGKGYWRDHQPASSPC